MLISLRAITTFFKLLFCLVYILWLFKFKIKKSSINCSYYSLITHVKPVTILENIFPQERKLLDYCMYSASSYNHVSMEIFFLSNSSVATKLHMKDIGVLLKKKNHGKAMHFQ